MDQHYQLVNMANGKTVPANSFDVKIIPSNIRKTGVTFYHQTILIRNSFFMLRFFIPLKDKEVFR